MMVKQLIMDVKDHDSNPLLNQIQFITNMTNQKSIGDNA
jgi:hypothetical protein